MKQRATERLKSVLGEPIRKTLKVLAWPLTSEMGAILQIDAPSRDDTAFLWLPYPPDGGSVPEIALTYAGGSGRHSGTYASPGIKKGEPALKLFIRTEEELEASLRFALALKYMSPLPEVQKSLPASNAEATKAAETQFSPPPAPKARREAIPRAVQREVWQRDGGRCVECNTRERLCFDHIVPFSRGGSNTIRNIQLLCEGCNLSKGNRI